MKKFLFAAVAVLVGAVSQASFVLDFEELSVNDIVTDQYSTSSAIGLAKQGTEENYVGVTFSNTTGGSNVVATNIPGATGLSGIVLGVSQVQATKVRADFETGVLGVAINIGDNNGDNDDVFLEAYDSGNNLLDSDTMFISSGSSNAPVLSVSSGTANIAYVLMWGEGGFSTPKTFSVGIDNMAVESVPEPATMTLLGLGALAAWRKRKKA